jgi:hypothetical protein
MTFVQGDPGWVHGLAINQWSMQTFMVEDTWPDLGKVESDLGFADGAVVGVVRNHTGRVLHDVVVVLGTEYVRLGDLDSGAEADVRLQLAGADVQFFGPPISYRLFEEELQQPGPGGPPREVQLKQRVMEAAFSSSKYSPISSSRPMEVGKVRGLTLIAWMDRAPPEVRVAGRQPTQQTTALYVLPLDYRLPANGRVSVPPGFVESRVIQMPTEGGPCGPDGVPAVYVGRGEAVYEYKLDERLQQIQLTQLTLSLRSEGGGWRQAPDVAVYDWSSEAWFELSKPEFGDNPIAEIEGLVGVDGLVRVRLAVDNPAAGACYLVGLGLEGEQ